MEEKLIVYKVGAPERTASVSARIEKEPYAKLEEVSEKTGISICKLTSLFIDYAYSHLEIKDYQ